MCFKSTGMMSQVHRRSQGVGRNFSTIVGSGNENYGKVGDRGGESPIGGI